MVAGLLLRMREPMFWRQALMSGEMLCDVQDETWMEEMLAHRWEAEGCVSGWGW
jgi:hypothetical protein